MLVLFGYDSLLVRTGKEALVEACMGMYGRIEGYFAQWLASRAYSRRHYSEVSHRSSSTASQRAQFA